MLSRAKKRSSLPVQKNKNKNTFVILNPDKMLKIIEAKVK
jgi:hypothetical protein